MSERRITGNQPYCQEDRDAIYRVIAERRDMRHFSQEPLDPQVLKRLFRVAHQAPSVGLMQPWRFLRITDRDLRGQICELVELERQQTADALGERRDQFVKLKVEGIRDCAEVVVAALPEGRDAHVFGRRTLPEMDLASLACAIQNMWLAARAEGIGLGWVSLFDPQALADLLKMPVGSKPVAILCIGHVDGFYEQPMLVQEKWAQEAPLEAFIFENYWSEPAPEV
ncbi:5,6-dimethylbenzimidazole synthase [Pontibacterium granulatum]|uniref:5,6-dimethylbenzimidazole synthase n=1 Tax=Pontibacterium granulatum TaxID=2036029 RepID=UPI00249BE73B|nr:5,6-dimethylbenzimidazole synthase [Pontibacterium granulatum]MDI3323987.1 5,6-dimethylbenzimidazole synthase [Pontibacterium granulatum]